MTQDGPDNSLPTVLDNLIAQHRVPAMVAVMIQNGGGDAQGSERGLEYDTMSGRYAEFVESEVLPARRGELPAWSSPRIRTAARPWAAVQGALRPSRWPGTTRTSTTA